MNSTEEKISTKRRQHGILPIGHTSHFLQVISEPIYRAREQKGVYSPKVRRFYLCRCECGTEKEIVAEGIGKTQSCGCKKGELLAKAKFKHGGHRGKNNGGAERLYMRWCQMKERCLNPNNKRYPDYGGRGITICDEWKADYAVYRTWAESNGYRDSFEIDRKDNHGPYSPDNCRWVPHQVNSLNTRRSRFITAFSETKTASEWASDLRCKTGYKALLTRIDIYGWTPEKAITTPTKSTNRNQYEPEYSI